jgi:hypothetical protein
MSHAPHPYDIDRGITSRDVRPHTGRQQIDKTQGLLDQLDVMQAAQQVAVLLNR